jgi:hypothetical protein
MPKIRIMDTIVRQGGPRAQEVAPAARGRPRRLRRAPLQLQQQPPPPPPSPPPHTLPPSNAPACSSQAPITLAHTKKAAHRAGSPARLRRLPAPKPCAPHLPVAAPPRPPGRRAAAPPPCAAPAAGRAAPAPPRGCGARRPAGAAASGAPAAARPPRRRSARRPAAQAGRGGAGRGGPLWSLGAGGRCWALQGAWAWAGGSGRLRQAIPRPGGRCTGGGPRPGPGRGGPGQVGPGTHQAAQALDLLQQHLQGRRRGRPAKVVPVHVGALAGPEAEGGVGGGGGVGAAPLAPSGGWRLRGGQANWLSAASYPGAPCRRSAPACPSALPASPTLAAGSRRRPAKAPAGAGAGCHPAGPRRPG